MIHHIIFKMAITSRDGEGAVIIEQIKGIRAPVVIFYILNWVLGDTLPLVNLKNFIVKLVKDILEAG